MVSQISKNGKSAPDLFIPSFHFSKPVTEIEFTASTNTNTHSRLEPYQTQKLTSDEVFDLKINSAESWDGGKTFNLDSFANHIRDGKAILPSVLSKTVPNKPVSSQLVVIDIDDTSPDSQIIKSEYAHIYYPSQSFYQKIDGGFVRKTSKTRQIIILSRPIVFDAEPLPNEMTQEDLYKNIVRYIGSVFSEYSVPKKDGGVTIERFDDACFKPRQFYWGCVYPEELKIYPDAPVFDVDSFIGCIGMPGFESFSIKEEVKTSKSAKTDDKPVKTDDKPVKTDDKPAPVEVIESVGVSEDDEQSDKDKLSTKVLKFIKKEIWDKLCFTPDSTGKHICNGVPGWYDANKFYNLYEHNWYVEQSESDMFCNFRGRRYGVEESKGGWCNQKEDYLPPIYGSRSGNNGKNIIQYFKDFHPDLEGYSLKGTDYKFVVSFICNYFGVPPYPFDNRGQIAYDMYKYLGNGLKFNELTGDIEYQGKPIDEQFAYTWVVNRGFLPKQAPKEYVLECLVTTAMRNSYHPIVEYLDSLPIVKDTSIIDNLSKRFLGTSNPLHDEMVKKTLIAAVARQYNPGCQLDTCLVFKGIQGIKKSSFFETLTPDSTWFDRTFSLNTSSDSGNKDEKSKLRKKWILEIQELDVAFGQKETAAYRTLFTTRTDSHRVPYGRVVKDFPRNSIFVATVNAQSFLSDNEGNRRYWVIDIPLKAEINTHELERCKNAIWSAAKTLYLKHRAWIESGEDASKSPYKYWFDLAESKVLNENNRAFEKADYYQEELLPEIEKYAHVNIWYLAEVHCKVSKHDRKVTNAITKMLTDAGWDKRQVSSGRFKNTNRWYNPNPENVKEEYPETGLPDGF